MSSQHAAALIAQLAAVLSREGMSGSYVRAGADEATGVPVRFLLRHPGVRDDAIVNAYGVGAQIVTLAHAPMFAAMPPGKFDSLLQASGARLVFDSAVPRALGDVVVAWTAYCRGAGE